MENEKSFPDPVNRLRHIIDQEFNLERLLRMQDMHELAQLEEKIQFLLEESNKPYVSPIAVSSPFSMIPTSKDSVPVLFQDTNGNYLSLSCLHCGRNNFTSVQGLINHNRSAHDIHISNVKQAVAECGVMVDPTTLPEIVDVKQLQFTISVSPMQSPIETRVQSPEQAEDGRMKRGALELPKLKLKQHEPNLYLKKKLIIGNLNQFIAPDKRAVTFEKCSYRWLLYVRTKHAIDITTFIKKVRIFLHASYKPQEVIEFTEPPYYLLRLGWGEFIARIQIFFHDPKNQPIDIPYHIKLDQQYTGKELIGDEKTFELLLHKETNFYPEKAFQGHDKQLQIKFEDDTHYTSQAHPIPSTIHCIQCGGHCTHSLPKEIYCNTSESFQYVDNKQADIIKYRQLPIHPIRKPQVSLDPLVVKEIVEQLGITCNDDALVLVATVIFTHLVY